MKNTALTYMHEQAGARLVDYAGFRMPVEYAGVINEHNAVRNIAGVFDASHMGEFMVKGKNAQALLQYTTTNDVSKLRTGQAQYTCLPNGKGGIIDDLIIYKFNDKKYMLVVNCSNIEKDWEWLNRHNSFSAELENTSEKMSLIALQGPKSKKILQPLIPVGLDNLKSFTFITTSVAGVNDVIVSATGYTGAGGFEIYCLNENAPKIWNTIIEKGAGYGLQPAGLAARDTLRLEMGYCLYGNDINDCTSPIEAGLGWIVKFAQGKNFIDREFLEKQKKEGVTRKLVGFEMIERGIPRKDYCLLNSMNENIGFVTSGTMSPTLQKGIGMGYVRIHEDIQGNDIYVQIRNKTLKARVVKIPFIKIR
jgi:aminomethyltransferase